MKDTQTKWKLGSKIVRYRFIDRKKEKLIARQIE